MNRAARFAAATALCAVLAGTAACGTGADIKTQPKASAVKDDSAPKGEKSEKSKEKEAAKDAKVGDTITLKGMEDGSQLDVTVMKVEENAQSGDEFSTPQEGQRFYGVQFQLVNTGTKAYNDSPSNGAQLADAQGQQFQSTIADITAGPSMSASVKLRPGAKALGWIVFEVPKDAKVDLVQFAMDSGFSDQTGEWKTQ